MKSPQPGSHPLEVAIPLGRLTLHGVLSVPASAVGTVLFAHGSGSGRLSPRNRFVADVLQRAGLATLLFDLLTIEEERMDAVTMHLRFDIDLLAGRLVGATDWLMTHPDLGDLPMGYFGASTGAAAALKAAAMRPDRVAAVVSRGGRPDLARAALAQVTAPSLLIVGERDTAVIGMNQEAMAQMFSSHVEMEIIPGATHLFEEPEALEMVAGLARDWFLRYLRPRDDDPGE